ncbi:MAG: methyltransferase domain-containing protein [Opitutaceae bacterium]|nr:methyltransferase domain-containing protein [Opitutaceae bacterium]
MIKSWLNRQQFHPGPIGWLVNPFYFARRGLLAGLAEFLPYLRGRVLDVGCGSQPYRELIPATVYVGMEIDTPRTRASFSADVYYDGLNFPWPEASFDGALCSQVFEHVFNPPHFLAELNRVLRPGGVLVLAVPFAWDEHEQPHDFARYSSFGLKALLEAAGFEVVAQRKTLADGRVLFQLINTYLYKVTLTRHPRVNRLITLLLMAPVSLAGILAGWILPANPDLFLDNIVLARKRSDPRRE